MRLFYIYSQEATPATDIAPPLPSKKTRKMLYIALGIIAVAAVSSAFGLVLFYLPSYSITITSTPTGNGFIIIDGKPATTPYTVSWQGGSKHNVTANGLVSTESGVEYAYSTWSDSGSESHIVTVNSSVNYTATFLTFIPLTYDYTPGEEMTYNLTDNVTLVAPPINQTTSSTNNMTMKVISFDGENYTINETAAFQILNSSHTIYFTYNLNKTGYITSISSPSETSTLSSWLNNFQLTFEKNGTIAGETWEIPFNMSAPNDSSINFNGNLTETFGDIQNIAVPAGTYRVFNVDVSSTNLTAVINLPPLNESIFENITLNGQMYLEYGTCRAIQLNMQTNVSYSQGGLAYNEILSEQVELVEDIKT